MRAVPSAAPRPPEPSARRARARHALAAAVATCGLLLATLPPGALALSKRAYVNGDSLAVGTAPYLPGLLKGWRLKQSSAVSRHAPEGPPLLRKLGRALPRVIVVSLGTNDDPGTVDVFHKAVRDTMDIAGKDRCVVWVNIVRPPYEGVSYAGYNRALARESKQRDNLRVVRWTKLAKAHPEWFGKDGVHPNATGYKARADALARAVKRCS